MRETILLSSENGFHNLLTLFFKCAGCLSPSMQSMTPNLRRLLGMMCASVSWKTIEIVSMDDFVGCKTRVIQLLQARHELSTQVEALQEWLHWVVRDGAVRNEKFDKIVGKAEELVKSQRRTLAMMKEAAECLVRLSSVTKERSKIFQKQMLIFRASFLCGFMVIFWGIWTLAHVPVDKFYIRAAVIILANLALLGYILMWVRAEFYIKRNHDIAKAIMNGHLQHLRNVVNDTQKASATRQTGNQHAHGGTQDMETELNDIELELREKGKNLEKVIRDLKAHVESVIAKLLGTNMSQLDSHKLAVASPLELV
eukprot:c22531_g1_i1 orf=30-965(+)